MDPLAAACTSPFLRPSFSQFGEDRTIWWLFGGKRNGFYVDVGCHHPLDQSNTALLHLENGWSGLNIDLDPRAIAAFNEARPNDRNILVAVGREAGQAEAIIFAGGGQQNTLGSIKADLAHLAYDKVRVDVLPLSPLLERHVPPGTSIDFMTIDAEGFDFDVLASNDWTRYRPTVIAIEVDVHDMVVLLKQPVHAFLVEKGYVLFSHSVVTSFYRIE